MELRASSCSVFIKILVILLTTVVADILTQNDSDNSEETSETSETYTASTSTTSSPVTWPAHDTVSCPQYIIYTGSSGRAEALIWCWILGTHGGQCYCFSHSTTTNWYIADSICKKNNMKLLSIKSKKENDYLSNHIYYNEGLRNRIYWTSGVYNGTSWIWSATGQVIDDYNGNPLRPSWSPEENRKGKCITFNNLPMNQQREDPGRELKDIYCASYGYRFICEK